MTDVKAILEALKKFESADEGTEIYWKAQDIALEGCKAISNKLQEHIKNGYVEDFYKRAIQYHKHSQNLESVYLFFLKKYCKNPKSVV